MLRKLAKLTCSDKFSRIALEKRDPNLCTEIEHAMSIRSCDQSNRWIGKRVSENITRISLFEERILRYNLDLE